MKDRNKRKLIIYVLVGVLMLTTVAYAALSTVLNVSGTVVKKGNLWNIYFTNPSSASIVGTATGSSINIQASSLNFQVSLYKPGDKVTYTVDIKNGGTIDAVLNSISLTGLDTAKSNSLNYTVTYSNGSTIKEGDTLNIGASRTIKITVEFDSSATSIPESDVNLTFGVTLIYGQSTSSSSTGTSGITSNNVIAGIYGESIQNGTPTPTSPVEIESVGEKTKNIAIIKSLNSLKEQDGIYTSTKQDTATSLRMKLQFKAGTNYVGKIVETPSSGRYSITLTAPTTEWKYLRFSNNGKIIEPSIFFDLPYEKYKGKTITFSFTIVDSNVATFSYKDIQLEEGSTATEYEPYGYKIPITVSNGTETKTANIYLKEPLRKIGEYADYLDLTNGKVTRYVKEVVFTGTETINLGDNNRFEYPFEKISGDGLCNYYKNTNNKSNGSVHLICTFAAYFSDTRYNTVEEFKNMLATQYNLGNPVKIVWRRYDKQIFSEESIDVPEIPSLTGNVTYSVGTSIKPSSINYTTR